MFQHPGEKDEDWGLLEFGHGLFHLAQMRVGAGGVGDVRDLAVQSDEFSSGRTKTWGSFQLLLRFWLQELDDLRL